MKIGITGATGFLGKNLLKEYAHEHSFIVTSTRDPKNIEGLCIHTNIKYVKCDYETESLVQCFNGCDAVIHMAAKRPDNNSESSFTNYYDNIRMSENVFEAARILGLKNVVLISTRLVYSDDLPSPIKEEFTKPYSYYGISKLMSENIANIYNKRFGMKIKSLRMAQIIGIGERKNLMTIYLERSLAGEKLSVYGKGISSKAYVYVKDAARAVMTACSLPDVSGEFNICIASTISNKELAEAFCEVFENKSGYELLEDKAEDCEYWLVDNSKAERELGFVPEFDLRKALTDMRNILRGEEK